MLDDHDTLLFIFARVFFVILEIPRNRLTVHSVRLPILGFFSMNRLAIHAPPPGDANWLGQLFSSCLHSEKLYCLNWVLV